MSKVVFIFTLEECELETDLIVDDELSVIL